MNESFFRCGYRERESAVCRSAALVALLALASLATGVHAQEDPTPEEGVQRPMHVHEPLKVDPNLSWRELIDHTLEGFPSLAAVQARASEADALSERASRWLAAR